MKLIAVPKIDTFQRILSIVISVDFNEEYTALFGGYFYDQTNYLAECIKTVLKLYESLPNNPKSVVIIAHSMVYILKKKNRIISSSSHQL